MSNNYLGEIKLLPYDWPPKGWLLCAGQLLPISSYNALFSLLGTTYGGDGRTTFALPDLRSRVPVHSTNSPTLPLGAKAGVEHVTLTQSNLPAHTHTVAVNNTDGDTQQFANSHIAAAANAKGSVNLYEAATNLQPLDPAMVSSTGGNQSHENRQPSLVMNYCIATEGIFPSRN